MARTTAVLNVPPEAVWSVLSKPPAYGEWVVGSREVVRWDRHWPQRGARLQHRTGLPGLTLSDHTEVLDSEPGRRLLLRANARPMGAANIELTVTEHPDGTEVTMIEDPAIPFPLLLFPAPLHLLLRLRNREALRRLGALAERED
jgi:uncharacterized protein YndB with AHSA1/START domain